MFRGSVKSTGYPLHSLVSPFTSPPVRHRVPSHFNWSLLSCKDTVSRGQLKCDGTRAETRFRLSAKRTSPFKSVGRRQFSRLLAAGVCASAVVMLDTPCSEVVWRVLATHCIRQFPFHIPSHASPCAITFQLDSNNPMTCCSNITVFVSNLFYTYFSVGLWHTKWVPGIKASGVWGWPLASTQYRG